MKLSGLDGELRIYDSSAILHGAAPRDEATVDVVKWDGSTTWTNITSDVETDDAGAASAFITDNDDAVFVGSDVLFAMLQYLKGAGTNYAAGSGALKVYYFDGTDFSNAITDFNDGTASGGDCFAQDGYVDFAIPKDWAVGANTVNAALDADKYYVKLMATTSPSTDPDADVLCPCDGQYFEISFSAMDFGGPVGRPLVEEMLELDRGRMDAKAHYRPGSDAPIYAPVMISNSFDVDDVYNKDDFAEAVECGNPGTSRWSGAGVTSKGTTKNDGSNYNPAFADASKKAVNVQVLFDAGRTGGIPIGFAYYEVFFPPEEQSLAEAEDGIPITINGGCYGVIEKIHGFGNRY